MAELKAFVKLLESTVRADRLSGSKIKLLTEQALGLLAQATELVTAFLRLNKSLSPATQQRISALYVFDAIARGVKDLERKEKRDGGVDARGMLLRMEGAVGSLIEGMADDGKGGEWIEGREKAKKMIEIWAKNNTFPRACLDRLRANIAVAPPQAGPSTTPPGSPPGSPGYMSTAYDTVKPSAAAAAEQKSQAPDPTPAPLPTPTPAPAPVLPAGALPPEIAKLLGVGPPAPGPNSQLPQRVLSPGTGAAPLDLFSILAHVRPPAPPGSSGSSVPPRPPTHSHNSNTSALSPGPPTLPIDPARLAALAQLALPPRPPSSTPPAGPGGAFSPPPQHTYQTQQQQQQPPYGRPGYSYGPNRSAPRASQGSSGPPLPGQSYNPSIGPSSGSRRSPSPPRRDRDRNWDRGSRGEGGGAWQSRPRDARDDTPLPPRPWEAAPASGPRDLPRRRSRSPQRTERPRPSLPDRPSLDPPATQPRPRQTEPAPTPNHAQDGAGEEDMALDEGSDDERGPVPGPARLLQGHGLPARPGLSVPPTSGPGPSWLPPAPISVATAIPAPAAPAPAYLPRPPVGPAPPAPPPGSLAAFDPATFNPADPAAWAGLGRAWLAQTGREPGQMELMGFVMSGGKMGPGAMDAAAAEGEPGFRVGMGVNGGMGMGMGMGGGGGGHLGGAGW